MTTKGIIFSAPMVRALLDGRKTQTRRLAKPRKGLTMGELISDGEVRQKGVVTEHWVTREMLAPPAYNPGDRLYVREAWSHTGDHIFEIHSARMAGVSGVIYHADDNPRWPHAKYWPSIHMPREFSRLWLTVTEVRVQRLQDISEADAIAEGAQYTNYGLSEPRGEASLDGGRTWAQMPGREQPGWSMTEAKRPEDSLWTATSSFANIWGQLHTTEGERWQDNPWIVAVSFDVHHGNIDREGAA